MKVLVLNGGSSSFKCWYSELESPLPAEPPRPQWQRDIEAPVAVLDPVLKSLSAPVDVVGHRIVHGGSAYRESRRITADVRAGIAQQAELAPSHNRLELEAMQAVDRVFGPGTPQIAVFDTAFHSSLPPAAYVYPGPYEWLDQSIRRFGFHGISHQYASRRAAHLLGRDPNSLRLITCHLGNGASLAAIRGGRSIDTTMGFTPLEGIMMGTRSGSVDPGILIYLVRHRGYTADQLDRILNQQSGLLGVSGLSGDMREILAHIAQGHERAQLAFDVYVHRLCRGIGAMLASLGGLDALIFTGGIGENCAPLRERVAKQFEFLGMQLDPAVEQAARPVDRDISTPDSKVRILVIRAEEDWEIARECYRIITEQNAN